MSKFINRSTKSFNIDVILPTNTVNHISTCCNDSKISAFEIFCTSILSCYYRAEFIMMDFYNTVNIINSKINIKSLLNYTQMTNYNITNSVITYMPDNDYKIINYRIMMLVILNFSFEDDEDDYEDDDYLYFAHFSRILQKLNIN